MCREDKVSDIASTGYAVRLVCEKMATSPGRRPVMATELRRPASILNGFFLRRPAFSSMPMSSSVGYMFPPLLPSRIRNVLLAEERSLCIARVKIAEYFDGTIRRAWVWLFLHGEIHRLMRQRNRTAARAVTHALSRSFSLSLSLPATRFDRSPLASGSFLHRNS